MAAAKGEASKTGTKKKAAAKPAASKSGNGKSASAPNVAPVSTANNNSDVALTYDNLFYVERVQRIGDHSKVERLMRMAEEIDEVNLRCQLSEARARVFEAELRIRVAQKKLQEMDS